jgi:hypothetical protein
VLGARTILKIHPVWSLELEQMTQYTYLDLLKCLQLLLSNYNEVKIGQGKFTTTDIFGTQPHIFEYSNKIDDMVGSEMLNSKTKSSVSPKKFRKIIKPLELGSRTKSVKHLGDEGIEERNTYEERYQRSPHSGILKDRKIRKIQKNPKGIDLGIKLEIASPASEDETDEDGSISDRKVSFDRYVSVQHGSKKLIEYLDETSEGADQTPEKEGPSLNDGLRLKRTQTYVGQNIQVNDKNQKAYNKFKTPLEVKGGIEKEGVRYCKPPLYVSTSSNMMVTTEKREMSPKAWKANRIRNQHKKIENPGRSLHKPYKSIERDEPVSAVMSSHPSAILRPRKELGKNITINDIINSKSGHESENEGEEENIQEFYSDEEAPQTLMIKPTKQPSFMSDINPSSDYFNPPCKNGKDGGNYGLHPMNKHTEIRKKQCKMADEENINIQNFGSRTKLIKIFGQCNKIENIRIKDKLNASHEVPQLRLSTQNY